MTKYPRSLLTLFLCFLLSAPALADQVLLKNGDRVSGKVIEQREGSVVIETEYAGAVKIAASHIEKVTLNEAEKAEADKAVEKPTPAEKPQAVKTAASDAPKKRLFGGDMYGLTHGWSGNANVGFSYTGGNSQNTTMTTSLRAVKTGGVDNLTVYVRSLWNSNRKLSVNNTTSNAYWGGARYDRNFDGDLFGFGSFDFESDRPKNLNFRSVVGGGVGQHTIKNDRTELDVLTGGAWNHTWQTGRNSDSPEALVGSTLRHKFTDKLKLQNSFTFFQNVTDSHEFRYILDTTLSVDLTKKVGWFVTVGNRFNNDPVGSNDKNDFLFTTGMRFSYGQKK